MANGMWAVVARLLGLEKPRPTRPREHSDTRITTRTWGKGRGPGASPKPAPPRPHPPAQSTAPSKSPSTAQPTGSYAGDFTGTATLAYAARDDGNPDPGEVVWAWVPFEEDHSQGKDRPVLVIARTRTKLLGLMLTSKDHDRDAAQEARHGRAWLDIGTGAWDHQNRPSEVRLDRVLQLDPGAVRREGAALDEPLYEEIAAAVRKTKGW